MFVVNRAGSLIYVKDHLTPRTDVEQTFSYPLDIVLKVFDDKLVVDFGARDNIKSTSGIIEPTYFPCHSMTDSYV